jgi:glucokinase
MKYKNDRRIVLTLDAGGTNFVFSAIQGTEEIVEPVRLPSQADKLDACLKNIIEGFKLVKSQVKQEPVAISFAFPGPADYPNGIIGDLGNLPAFRGGIALGPMLKEKFNLPVFINNDGNLFALGEAIGGFLPYINSLLEKRDSPKRYHNLFGITLGTGFGAGIVNNNQLLIGDNSAAGEIWLLRNKLDPKSNAEEGVSIRAIRRVYADKVKEQYEDSPDPKDIYEIGTGKKEGDKKAAMEAFRRMGEVTGDALANAITLIDGIIVIGGGLSGAHSLFLPTIVEEMNSKFETFSGDSISRMETKVYNLEEKSELEIFINGNVREIIIPDTNNKITYDSLQRVGVGISKLNTNKATSVGAYAFALAALDKE